MPELSGFVRYSNIQRDHTNRESHRLWKWIFSGPFSEVHFLFLCSSQTVLFVPCGLSYDSCPWRLPSWPASHNGLSIATRWTIPHCALLLITVSQRGSPTTTPWKEPRARQVGRSWVPCKTIPPYSSSSHPHIPRRSVLKAGIMHRGDRGAAHGHVCSREKLRCHHLALLSIPFASAREQSIRMKQGKETIFFHALCPIFHVLFKVYSIEMNWILTIE